MKESIIKQIAYEEAVRNFWLYEPYEKQKEFHNLGDKKRERAFFAGNQLGKTLSLGHEMAFHLTGIYPDWWDGKRFEKPIEAWAGGVTNLSVRDIIQSKLFGNIKDEANIGGIIHKSYIIDYTSARSVADAIDTVWIKHKSGGKSMLQLKSYEQGREKWQGTGKHVVWFDEEPPEDIYIEGLARTNATDGIAMLSFTPLKGLSNVVLRFWKEMRRDCALVMMGIKDALHYDDEQRRKIMESYPAFEREARSNGIPSLGSGRIFPIAPEQIMGEVPKIPNHWARIVGLDFGWDHPTAVVWIAWDRDTDTAYVYDCYKQPRKEVSWHARAIRAKGEWMPVAWPHDGLQHDKGSGTPLAELYRKEGVNMLNERASFEDGSNSVEAGLAMMLERMEKGQLKIAQHLKDWWDEFEIYHRDNGHIVKERDDLMSATRYGLMMLRFASVEKTQSIDYDLSWVV